MNYGYGGGGYEDGGGGFMQAPSQHGGGGFGDNTSPGKRGGGGGQQRVASVAAVTIKQLHGVVQDPTGDGFRFPSGKDVSAVRLVGRIQEVTDEPGKTRFSVEDGTGRVTLTLFFTEGEDLSWSETRAQLHRGVYVDVFSQLKTVGGAVAVIPQTVKLVTDFNQITHHILQAMTEHVMHKFGPIESAAAAGAAAGGLAPGLGARYGSVGVGYGGGGGGGAGVVMGGAFGGGGGGGGGNGMDNVTEAVFNAFKAEGDSEDGADVETIVGRLRAAGITRHQVEQAIQTLTTDGFIYSTIDEQHYRATS